MKIMLLQNEPSNNISIIINTQNVLVLQYVFSVISVPKNYTRKSALIITPFTIFQ